MIRRPDGRLLEMSPLLFSVASCLDGHHELPDIARIVSQECGRPVSANNVAYLIDRKLRPLEVLGTSGDSRPRTTRGAPLLGLQFRAAVVPQAVARGVSWLLRPLFNPVAVIAVVSALVGFDAWMVLDHRIGEATKASIYRPGVLLLLLGLTLAAAVFHELGHATATKYGGADPGRIGVGIYLIWPVFYNDLTDTYRLSRGGRLRADLGGVYFNSVFIVAVAAMYAVTGFQPLLLIVVIQHLAIAQQFLPFVRLDGYYLVSDIAGVPNLFGAIRPTLARLMPHPGAVRRQDELTPWARVVVAVWVATTVPLLVGCVVLLGWSSPHLAEVGWKILIAERAALVVSLNSGNVVGTLLSGFGLLFVSIPVLGLVATVVRALLRGARLALRNH